MKDIILDDGNLSFLIERSLYSEDIVYKCFYWFSNNFDVSISEDESSHYFKIFISSKDPDLVVCNSELVSKVKQDLIDFKLRDIITKETQTIRELLVAKAFSHYEDAIPNTDVEDPVGFNPENIY